MRTTGSKYIHSMRKGQVFRSNGCLWGIPGPSWCLLSVLVWFLPCRSPGLCASVTYTDLLASECLAKLCASENCLCWRQEMLTRSATGGVTQCPPSSDCSPSVHTSIGLSSMLPATEGNHGILGTKQPGLGGEFLSSFLIFPDAQCLEAWCLWAIVTFLVRSLWQVPCWWKRQSSLIPASQSEVKAEGYLYFFIFYFCILHHTHLNLY